jgi:putative ATPase
MQHLPLAENMRPTGLDDYIGQKHLVGENSTLRKMISTGLIPSMIFWGPPGTGKTTLANIIAKSQNRLFYTLSAISSGVKDVREVIEKAKENNLFSKGNPILFIDEIHRFSKAQQDSLLGAVEKGTVTLIGATTENPSFEVIPALLSRSQVYILKHLEKNDLLELIERAVQYIRKERGINMQVQESEAIMRLSGGDARKLLNIMDILCGSGKKEIVVTNDLVTETIQQNIALYDKAGEMHYDVISAFIKSIRGSDPNAAVYWLARMISGGEDPSFIARRLLILASEDIGNANPTALVIANNCFQAVNVIGYPECRIILSQATVYLATSPKSNSTYMAINNAQAEVEATGHLPVPLHLRNAPTKLMKDIGYGAEYKYSHDYENNFSGQEHLPEEIAGKIFYEPGNNQRELQTREWLKKLWKEQYNY